MTIGVFFCCCLSAFRGVVKSRGDRDSEKLFYADCSGFEVAPGRFAAVNFSDFVRSENFFKLNIGIYQFQEDFIAQLVQRSASCMKKQ